MKKSGRTVSYTLPKKSVTQMNKALRDMTPDSEESESDEEEDAKSGRSKSR